MSHIRDDGWDYDIHGPVAAGDCRKLVTLEQDGMTWVGIRAFDHANKRWLNNNEPETARVIAFRDMPEPGRHRWLRGILT